MIYSKEKFLTKEKIDNIKKINILNLWVVRQFKGEYNPIHYHEGDLSGVGYLKLPKNMTNNKFLLTLIYSRKTSKISLSLKNTYGIGVFLLVKFDPGTPCLSKTWTGGNRIFVKVLNQICEMNMRK